MSIEPLMALQQRLGLDLPDTDELLLALTHRSWHEENGRTGNNERLEYLGDAVLKLVVTEMLYRRFPESTEGELSRVRARLIGEVSLAEVAQRWKLDEVLLLGKGAEATGGRSNLRLLGNAVEAILGTVYLQVGLEVAARLLDDALAPTFDIIEDPSSFGKDPKSRLQELVQQQYGTEPRYSRPQQEGPAHERVFTVNVTVGDQGVLGEGSARSKKEAEKAAARAALKQIDAG